MHNASNAVNPGDAWLQATVSSANTLMSFASQATNAALSMWTAPLSMGAPSNSPPAPKQQEQRPVSQPSQAEPFRFWFALPASSPAPSRAPDPTPAPPAERSWYRAPYRSPFDPMFWMSPGHPVDHVQDWIAAMPMAASMMSAAMAGSQMVPGMPQLPGAPLPGRSFFGVPAGLPAFGMPAFGMPAFGMPAFGMPAFGMPAFGMPAFGMPAFGMPAFGMPTPAAAQWSPLDLWMAPWRALLGSAGAMQPATSPYSSATSAPNVIDFGSAYAAYRTAGGHAAAQIVRTFTGATQPVVEPPVPSLAWLNPFDPFRLFGR